VAAGRPWPAPHQPGPTQPQPDRLAADRHAVVLAQDQRDGRAAPAAAGEAECGGVRVSTQATTTAAQAHTGDRRRPRAGEHRVGAAGVESAASTGRWRPAR